MTIRALVLLGLLLVPRVAFAAPPICDNPAAIPADLIQLLSQGTVHADFDSTYLFTVSVEVVQGEFYGALHRYSLDGSQHQSVPLTFFPADMAISSGTQRIYLTADLLVEDTGVVVYDFDLNEVGTLFADEPDPAPNGKAGRTLLLTVHPSTGALYVMSHGSYWDEAEQESAWISRIQRFDASGNYNGLIIENQLALEPGDLGYNVPNPPMPACGAWHYPNTLWVTEGGDVYLNERVNAAGDRSVVHRFAVAAQCDSVADVTGKSFGVDRDGSIYTASGNILTKYDQSWSEILYSKILQTAEPIIGIRFMAHTSDFALIATDAPGQTVGLRILGPQVEPLNIIGEGWQSTQSPYRLMTNDVARLAACDSTNIVMDGVVADGASPLLLRWKVPGPGEVRWEMKDMSFPTNYSLLGTLANLDSSDVDTVTVDTSVRKVDSEYFAFAVFTAPKNFVRKGIANDLTASSRNVSVFARYFPIANETTNLATVQSIRVERPPVILVHGLWGSSGNWSKFLGLVSNSNLWRVHPVNYPDEHGQSLNHHRNVGTVLAGLGSAREKIGDLIVSAQVDAVMHSMGGLLVRDFADGTDYKRPENYGYGDFHKLLFLDTPHEGSPLADMMVRVREIIGNPLIPSFTAIGQARRASALFTVGLLSIARGTKSEQITGKALDDLKTDSPALASLQELNVPTHAHVGNASSYFSILTPDVFRGLFALTSATASTVLGMTTFLQMPPSWTILANPSDLIVSTESQRGGLGSSHYEEVGDLPHSIHTEVPKSPFAGDLAEEWAQRRPDDATFFAPSIPAPSLSMQPGELAASSIEDSYELMPNFSGRLTLTVTEPAGATTTFPGKVIKVRVQGALNASDTVAVYYPSGALFGVYGNGTTTGFSQPNGLAITIPLEHAGPFELMAVGENGDNRMFASTTRVINVDPGAKIPPLTITDIHVEPNTVLLSGRGAAEQLRVTAEYSDGVERDITAGLGTTYAPGGGFWALTSDGVVLGKAPGSGYFTVTNAGHSINVPTTVLSGPQINNAPHADAGGPYAACDSQLVFLDGSASYDLDEQLGETLTYSWDLDADGQFDDASGQTPFVKLVFPGAYWLLGLKVTDSHGLESIDYAFLEAAPGCLDGEFVCAKTRSETNQAFVGVDGSGNFYVAEYGGFGDRIVKFSSNCDSILTIGPLPTQPSAIVVMPDGTIYIPDDNPDRVYKYAGDGTSLGFVQLQNVHQGHLAVDAAGNIYNAAPGSSIVRKFSPAGGSPIATWDVGSVSKIAVGADGAIYVASGDYVTRGVPQGGGYVEDWVIGGPGVDAGRFNQIDGLAVGPSGDIFVCDTNNDRIQRFKSDGTFVRLWTGSGKPTNGLFTGPGSIAIGPQEQVVVAELVSFQQQRIQVFGTAHTVVGAELEAYTLVGQPPAVFVNAEVPASGCPQGDGDRIEIRVAIDPSTVVGPIPASAFSLSLPQDDDAISYVSVIADADATLNNGKYRTTLTLRKFGGCLGQEVIVKLNGVAIGGVPVNLRSPDWDTHGGTPGGSYGIVNLQDFADFGEVFASPPKVYSQCADHRGPYGTVTLQDFSYYALHNNHTVGGALLATTAAEVSSGTLRLELEQESPVIGQRRLWARLVLDGVEPFKAMIVALRSERPELEYVGWHPSSTFAEASGCVEVVNNGVKQVFLGVMGVSGSQGSSVELGRVEFTIHSDDELVLNDEDLEFLQAELLSVDKRVLAFGGLRLDRTVTGPRYEFELAQNYPNPFNPSTTISFSVARSSDVTLSIFDVRGGLVKTLLRGRRDAGVHRVAWDGTDGRGVQVASGVYFYRLTAGSFRDTRKMVLLR